MSVQFIVGNEYKKLPVSQAKLDSATGSSSGKNTKRKIHDWKLCVDVLEGDPDVIEQVTFELLGNSNTAVFHCTEPVRLTQPDGSDFWRFSMHQQSSSGRPVTVKIQIRGCRGTIMTFVHTVEMKQSQQCELWTFREENPPPTRLFNKLPKGCKFGIELELSSAKHVSKEDIADELRQSARLNVDVVKSHSEGRKTSKNWKIVFDASIACNRSSPDCNTFEIVSPVLRAGNGLEQTAKILKALGKIKPRLQINKTMGFHLHIDVSKLSLDELIKVCQNFVKYEAAIDTIMPPSRRTGSAESNKYFQSNRQLVSQNGTLTNSQCLREIESCTDVYSLFEVMNGGNRYYKLNLENLATGRQPTIEFRQHSATTQYEKVCAWVHFCVAFVQNSADFGPRITAFSQNCSMDMQFWYLFRYIIRDHALLRFYRQRQKTLKYAPSEIPGAFSGAGGGCCDGCAAGKGCAKNRPANRFYRAELAMAERVFYF
jgi:hypothetical protein